MNDIELADRMQKRLLAAFETLKLDSENREMFYRMVLGAFVAVIDQHYQDSGPGLRVFDEIVSGIETLYLRFPELSETPAKALPKKAPQHETGKPPVPKRQSKRAR